MDFFSDTPDSPFTLPYEAGYDVETLDGYEAGYRAVIPDGELIYIEQFFDQETSDLALAFLQENDKLEWWRVPWAQMGAERLEKLTFKNINWQQDYLKMFGRSIALPRLTAWYGDAGKSYTYSGITSRPNPWNEGLLAFKREIEAFCNKPFNSVLLNWYRSGEDHMGWHADNEPELGENPVIASVSFGTERDFLLRKNDDRDKKIMVPLKHGSLLVMQGSLQHHWQHSVPKRKRVQQSRFNLTFRQVS